jgi:hypothetical protein
MSSSAVVYRPTVERLRVRSAALWIAVVAAVWSLTTWLFWVGYTGVDDLFYARYAFLFDGPPANWWEFRMPAVLALRASFLALGPAEFAAAVPTLVASIAMISAVAWLVDWPRTRTWQSHAAVLLAVLMPIDVGFRSTPGAPFMAAAFLVVASAAMLKGARRVQYVGAALFAIGFATHEISMFYVAIFCAVAVGIAPARFWRPVVLCVVLSIVYVAVEALIYESWVGNPLARFRMAASTTQQVAGGLDPDHERSDFWFLMWPLQNLIYCKAFGFTLGALFVSGGLTWRRLTTEQRILLTTMFLVWLWLGYGSQVPWAYRPLYRQFHYYTPLILASALLPSTLTLALGERRRLVAAILACAIVINVASLAIGGRWGAAVDVSRDLLGYARQHDSQRFITDLDTLNQMYALNGFHVPANVLTIDSPRARRGFFLGRQPDSRRVRLSPEAIDGVLVNEEQGAQRAFEPEFRGYLDVVHGARQTVAPPRYRLLFSPLARLIPMRSFMLQSLGGSVIVPSAGSLPLATTVSMRQTAW